MSTIWIHLTKIILNLFGHDDDTNMDSFGFDEDIDVEDEEEVVDNVMTRLLDETKTLIK